MRFKRCISLERVRNLKDFFDVSLAFGYGASEPSTKSKCSFCYGSIETPANLQSFTDCSWRMTSPIRCWLWTKRGAEDEGREEGEETTIKITKRQIKSYYHFHHSTFWRWVFLLSKFAKSPHFPNVLSKINHTWLLHIQYLRSCKCFTFTSCIVLVSVASVSKRHMIPRSTLLALRGSY